jgi:hypothetical protein
MVGPLSTMRTPYGHNCVTVGMGSRRSEPVTIWAMRHQPVAPWQIVHVRLGGFVDGDNNDLGMHTPGRHQPGERGIVVGLPLTSRGPLDA